MGAQCVDGAITSNRPEEPWAGPPRAMRRTESAYSDWGMKPHNDMTSGYQDSTDLLPAVG
jgi:hypothetical protein